MSAFRCTIQSWFEDYDTAIWLYWQINRNDTDHSSSFQDRPPVAVRTRVVLKRDGELPLGGLAPLSGFDGAIFVELNDRRMQTVSVWLALEDVRWEGKAQAGSGAGKITIA